MEGVWRVRDGGCMRSEGWRVYEEEGWRVYGE